MNSLRILSQEEENDSSTEVTWDDQQRINTFSKLNSRVRNLDEKLGELKQEKEALDDLSNELELGDEDELVIYKIGESFLHIPYNRALRLLERDKSSLNSQISDLSGRIEECEKEMQKLKTVLYAKFGSAINLDE
ncbi:Prefoldin subunit 4 [Thelephora ganbajun]|uniref:Prefoldin subunit 4 n=1 Tax=Thelephora ganbajun TaxID=370292 RepID=A0ACB6Z0W1_THEGA|nr:Prefoldin subunit 4 [Thelephora ganbajun]